MLYCDDKNSKKNKTAYLLAMIRTHNLLIVNPILNHIANKKQLKKVIF